MHSYMIDLILVGIAYIIMVYFMVVMLKKRRNDFGKGNDDDDGGITASRPPKIDLPPGVTWPDGSRPKKVKKEEKEEVFA
jgi:hypothetical protein